MSTGTLGLGDLAPEVLRSEVCVPLDRAGFDLLATAERLGMAVVSEPERSLWAFGPETVTGRGSGVGRNASTNHSRRSARMPVGRKWA